MKKIVIFALMISLVATCAFAEGETEGKVLKTGARVGYSFSPDQFFIGAHTDLGNVIGPTRLVPNIEFGFGGDWTTIALNADFLYDFEGTAWSVGGEVGIIRTSWDDHGYSDIPGVDYDTSSTDLGLSVLGGYRLQMSNGTTLLLEGKLGLANSPDFKLSVGYNFF